MCECVFFLSFCIQSVHTPPNWIQTKIRENKKSVLFPVTEDVHMCLSEPNNQRSIIVKGLQECTIITYEPYCVAERGGGGGGGVNQQRC